MAAAESLQRPSTPKARYHAEEFIQDIFTHEPSRRSECNIERMELAERAVRAPVLGSLWLMSTAWKAAVVMLDCYAMIPAGEEGHYYRAFSARTLEEVAEGMMQDARWDKQVPPRAFELGAKTALHALNWARQNPTN